MTRLGTSLLASELAALATVGDGWKEIANIDANPPTTGDLYDGLPGRVLRLWADTGIGGPAPYGFEARIIQGVGDISSQWFIGSQPLQVVTVPSQGLALPVPAGNVRVEVRLRSGAPSNPSCRIYAQIAHGAPVVTYLRGGNQCVDPVNFASVALDPETFPFAVSLAVAVAGAGNATINFGGGAVAISPGPTREFSFNSKLTLANTVGNILTYVIKQVW